MDDREEEVLPCQWLEVLQGTGSPDFLAVSVG